MYKFSLEGRVPGIDLALIQHSRGCPYDEKGRMQRVAQRDDFYPYAWVAIGWRCTHCGTLFIDLAKQDVTKQLDMREEMTR